MSLSGVLRIDIGLRDGQVADIRFAPARPVPVAPLFHRLPWREAAGRVSRLFAICGHAHAVALTLACEAAEALTPRDDIVLARKVLVAAEALREHAFRVLAGWPPFLGEAEHARLLGETMRAWRALARAAGGDVLAGEGALDPDAVLSAARDLARFGREELLPEAEAILSRLVARIGSGEAGEIAADIEDDGTVLGRCRQDPRLEGEGLARRLRARLVEIALLCNWLDAPVRACSPLAQAAEARGEGSGSARIHVARGVLEHAVDLRDGLIAGLRITAPTSGNFAPGGVAERTIAGLPAANGEAFEWLARLAILEIDPCVAHEVRIV